MKTTAIKFRNVKVGDTIVIGNIPSVVVAVSPSPGFPRLDVELANGQKHELNRKDALVLKQVDAAPANLAWYLCPCCKGLRPFVNDSCGRCNWSPGK